MTIMTQSAPGNDERLVAMATHSTDRQVVEMVNYRRRRSSHRCPAVISLSNSRVRLLVTVVLTLTALTTATALPRPFVGGTATKVRITSTGGGYRRRDLSRGSAVVIGGSDNRWSLSRNANQCVPTNGRCFTTISCCRGLICADLNDHPSEPGHCMRLKELQPCNNYLDCNSDSQCAQVTPGQYYCIPPPPPSSSSSSTSRDYRQVDPSYDLHTSQLASIKARQYFPDVITSSGLGSPCQTSADCTPLDNDGSRRFCCALVRRGFQQPRRMCDRITPVSICVASPS